MAALCREYGISTKTGFKFVVRYERLGEDGLEDGTRRPKGSPQATPVEMIDRIIALRQQYPTWGPRKLLVLLRDQQPGVPLPSRTTIANLLRRRQLTKPVRRRRRVASASMPLSTPQAPNDLWCIDFKGQFRLGNGAYCYPLTVTDAFSRMVLLCEAMDAISSDATRVALEGLFLQRGLPRAIRSDNGEPFVSSRALLGLSRLGAWWERLGILHERIDPGCPQQNGRHERMHRTLKHETTRPAAHTQLAQQERFDRWVHTFNEVRPHQALGGRTPESLYQASPRRFDGKTPLPRYPLHDVELPVWKGGIVRLAQRQRFFVSSALVGERLGLRELDTGRWLVTFVTRDLGHYDEQTRLFEAVETPDLTLTRKENASDNPPSERAAE
jgi:transposase InsO family protein